MLVEKIDEIIKLAQEVRVEAVKLEEKHVNAAGTKVNAAVKAIIDLAKNSRKEVSEIREKIKEEKASK